MNERLGSVVGGLDAIIWEMDAATRRFTYVSERAEKILGYRVEQWLARQNLLAEILHPEDRERVRALLDAAIGNARGHETEYRVLAASGRTVWLRDRVNVLTGGDGRPRLLQGVMIDITDQKGAQQALARAEAETRQLAARLAALGRAASASEAAEDADDLREILHASLAATLPADFVALGVCDDDAASMRLLTHRAADDSAAQTLALTGVPLERLVRDAMRPLLSAGGRSGSPYGEPASLLSFPLRADGRLTGALVVASRTADAYGAEDVALVEAMAAVAALALARIRARAASRLAATASRQSEAFSRLLQQVTAAANEAITFEEAAGACLAAICAHTGWPTAHVFVRSGDEMVSSGIWEVKEIARLREFTTLAASIRYRAGVGIVGRVLATGKPVWVEDATRERTYWRDLDDVQVRGAFAFPVPVAGDVAAVLEFFSRDPVAPDPALLELAGQIGIQLGRVIERERADDRIRFQARLLESVGQAVIASDANHRIVHWNYAAEMLYGWRREEVLGRTDSQVLQMRSDPAQTAEITAKLASGESWSGEFTVRHREGHTIPVHWTGAAAHDAAGDAIGYVGVATDLRRFKEAEQQLRQGQRLESIGRLAGGVAHDFNNLLTSIKGITRMMLEDVADGSPMRPDLEEIERNADRAATLTSQLLAFGRRQVLQPRVLDLNEIIREVEPMLGSVMKSDVELIIEMEPELGRVRVDATQIAQAIINLALNARDASPPNAVVTIRTANAELDDVDAKRYAYPVRRGRYVMLSVHDAGPALGPEDMEHIFEPFYTMKRPGAGNGLGLSTVYGIVKQSDGYVWVDSVAGIGTTFRVFLPRVSRDAERARTAIGDVTAPVSETLLLVEDEEAVRNLARRILTRHGYSVLEAKNGIEALAMCAGHPGDIDLVVTDVVMPGMGGGELARRLETARPGVPVLLMSGYTDDEIVRHGIAEARDWFLEKPFSPDALLRKVRDVLDSRI